MAFLNNFDANTVEPSGDFGPIPAGKYVAMITESEMMANLAKNGHYLSLTFNIIEGRHKGRKVWARLNLDHPNAQAVQIGRGQLSAICRAVGVMQPQDSVELHNLPLSITVVCKKRDDTGEITNEVKGFERRDAATTQPTAAVCSAPSATKAPWA